METTQPARLILHPTSEKETPPKLNILPFRHASYQMIYKDAGETHTYLRVAKSRHIGLMRRQREI